MNGETKNKRITRLLGKSYVEAERIAPLMQALIEYLESGAFSATAGDA